MQDHPPCWQLPRGAKRILALGAHSDDIEIGCGGALMKLAAQTPDLEVLWVVFSSPGDRGEEARRSADECLAEVAHRRVQIESFRDGFFPTEWTAIKERFESIKAEFDPDLVFTHFRDDRHQDHRVLSDLAWNTFRRHCILEYEIPKYDGDLGRPNFFVELPDEFARRKVEVLLRHFQTQRNKHWFTDELFLSLMRIRGMECGRRYAEAFHCRKLVV